MGKKPVILGRHLDALYLSGKCTVPVAVDKVLWEIKHDLQQNSDEKFAPLFEIDGVPGGMFYIRRSGRGRYQYVIENPAMYIEITKWKNLPSVQIQFKAQTLYEYDLSALHYIAVKVCRQFCGDESEPEIKVNRADIAVDFHPHESNWAPSVEDVVANARHRRVDYSGSEIKAITLGERSGHYQFQLYNKSKELLKSGKGWMYEVWRASGKYREGSVVWRAEARFNRTLLHQFKIDSVADLNKHLGDLMALGFSEGGSVRFCTPETRGYTKHGTVTRRPIAEWWGVIAGAFRDGLNPSGRKRSTPKPRHSFTKSIEMMGSYAAKAYSVARSSGFAPADLRPAEVGGWLMKLHQELLEGRGTSWPEKVNEKTRLLLCQPSY